MRASGFLVVRRLAALAALAGAAGCGATGAGPLPRAEAGTTAAIAAELDALAGPLTAQQRETFANILEDTLAKDPYLCRPSPREVFFGEAPDGARTIQGQMPHYGVFFGPMHYVVRRGRPRAEAGPRWDVSVTLAVALPREGGVLELPDCEVARELSGGDLASVHATCEGTPYASSGSIEVCPRSGTFTLPATHRAMRALLRRWSRDAEAYFTRDAASFGLPIHYDFEFVPAGEIEQAYVDITLPLATTCGRTPYFSAFRSGWSLPIVAHEVGHVLGLLDEYEALSGVTRLYPKTPFPGAEVSRMGLSMREGTRVLPLHHYLILRRYFCPEPGARGFYEGGNL